MTVFSLGSFTENHCSRLLGFSDRASENQKPMEEMPEELDIATENLANMTLTYHLQEALISYDNLHSKQYSPTLDQTLESLLKLSKTKQGRLESARKNLLPILLNFIKSISNNTSEPKPDHLFASLKIVRNLCAGEILNQNSFVEHKGENIVSVIVNSTSFEGSSGYDMIRVALQLLGNVCLAGEEHQLAVWSQFFPIDFQKLACIQNMEICMVLCMIVYTCTKSNRGRLEELSGVLGLPVMAAILRTASSVRIEEDWLQLLLWTICFEEPFFPLLFSSLRLTDFSNNSSCVNSGDGFTTEQAFLLSLLSENLNHEINAATVSKDFALTILEIIKKASGVVDSISRGNSALPTGCSTIDVLGYSLTILRDICASEGPDNLQLQKSPPRSEDDPDTVLFSLVDSLISSGLLELLLGLLRDLEPPAIIRKSRAQPRNGVDTGYEQECRVESSAKVCPYKGFRRDVVAVIGNCTFRRKHVQDKIRDQNGILLLMQQCVVDEDNPFLREWGFWTLRNLLEGNLENQREVAELELQGSTDNPEIAGLGLRVEVDQKSQRVKLVNS